MTRRRFVALAAIVFVGCGGSTSQGSAETSCTPASAVAVDMIRLADYSFEPWCFTVPAGTDVVFFNDDTILHRVATQDGQVESFDSGILAPGATYGHVFATPGTIALYCKIIAGMTATVIVTAP